MGRHGTESLVEYARPQPGNKVLDVASGTGEPAISLAVDADVHGAICQYAHGECARFGVQVVRTSGGKGWPPRRLQGYEGLQGAPQFLSVSGVLCG